METKKISELTEVTSPIATDVFPIVNGGETKKVQLTNIKNTLGINEIDTRLTTAEGEIDTAQTDINNAETVIGNETDTYSASSTYALGSLVIYNSLLYKCTTAITVAEAWNSAKWTQIDLVNVSSGLKGKILWTNSSPSTAMVSGTEINLSSDDYDTLTIIYGVYSGTNNNLATVGPILKGKNFSLIGIGFPSQGISTWYREINYNSNTKFIASTCRGITTTSTYDDNNKNIPLYIIGYKTGLFN